MGKGFVKNVKHVKGREAVVVGLEAMQSACRASLAGGGRVPFVVGACFTQPVESRLLRGASH